MSLKLEEAKEKLSKAPVKYMVIGYKSDGIRGIPRTFEMVVSAASEENIFDVIDALEECRVFNLSEVGTSEQWKGKAKLHSDKKTEDKERELLQKLKQKYPNE